MMLLKIVFKGIALLFCLVLMAGFGTCGLSGLYSLMGPHAGFSDPMVIVLSLLGLGIAAIAGRGGWDLLRDLFGKESRAKAGGTMALPGEDTSVEAQPGYAPPGTAKVRKALADDPPAQDGPGA